MAKLTFNNVRLKVDKGKVNYDLHERFASNILEGVIFDIEHLTPGEEARYVDNEGKIDFRKIVADKVKGIEGLEAEINNEIYDVEDVDMFLSLPDETDGGKVISAVIYEVSARILNSSYLTQDEVKN